MATYTTIFVCRPEELIAGFPGWLPPLEKPVRREIRNPFTGEVSVVESRDPEWAEETSDESEIDYMVVAIDGDYAEYLEGRLPPFVRGCPHWTGTGLTFVEIEALLRGQRIDGILECALYSPPTRGALVQRLPPESARTLVTVNLQAVAKAWAELLSTPEYTHSVSGAKLSDGWTADEALEFLQPIVELARQVVPGQQMYLLTEA
jgi:hypothetical protein